MLCAESCAVHAGFAACVHVACCRQSAVHLMRWYLSQSGGVSQTYCGACMHAVQCQNVSAHVTQIRVTAAGQWHRRDAAGNLHPIHHNTKTQPTKTEVGLHKGKMERSNSQIGRLAPQRMPPCAGQAWAVVPCSIRTRMLPAGACLGHVHAGKHALHGCTPHGRCGQLHAASYIAPQLCVNMHACMPVV